MKISERYYSHHSSLPKIKLHLDQTANLIYVIINWGEQVHADNLISEMSQYIHAASADVEVTHPYEVFPHLPKDVNILRIATLIGNDYLYRQENSHEYISGIEILVIKKNKNMLSWSRVGRPSLFQLKNQLLTPILVSNSVIKELPMEMLGIHAKVDIQCGHFPIEQSIDLIVYCGIDWPRFDRINLVNDDVENIFNHLIKVQPKISGFWLAKINE